PALIEHMFYNGSVAEAPCARCLALEDELAELRQQPAAAGRYVVPTPGPNTNPELERELKRWLAVNPKADAASGFRAGWTRLARFRRPPLHQCATRPVLCAPRRKT